MNRVKKKIKKHLAKQEIQLIKSGIKKSDLTLDLIESLVNNAHLVNPNFIFELHVLDDAVNGGVIGSKLFTSTFRELVNTDAEKLYEELTADSFAGRFEGPASLIDARNNF